MTQKIKNEGKLADCSSAPEIQKQKKKKKKKKSIAIPKLEVDLFNQILISSGVDATQKFNQISKGKSVVEPSNDNTDQMDVDWFCAFTDLFCQIGHHNYSFAVNVDIEDLGFNSFWKKGDSKEVKVSKLPPYDPTKNFSTYPEFLKSESATNSESSRRYPWYSPVSIEELRSLLKSNVTENGASFKLVVGNTGTGYYKETQRYDHYIDLRYIPEPSIIKRDQTGIEVGAAVTISKLISFLKEENKVNLGSYRTLVSQKLANHVEKIASPFVRNSASVGGNLVMAQKNGFPSDIATLFLGLCATALSIHFPEIILMDILSRLPVPSLLRFKCVSKYWETLISEPYFKKKHLNRAKNDQDSQKLLTIQMCSKNRIFSMYCCPLLPVHLVEDVQKLNFPSNPTPWHCRIHCCYDGLAVMEVRDNFKAKHSTLFLWNPSTRESIVLPSPEFPRGSLSCFGLGYDSTSGGYKIFQHYQGCSFPGEILALKGGSWRRIDEHPRGIDNRFFCRQFLAFVHAAFHWIAYSRNHAVVVSFSISNEVYGEIPFPEEISALTALIGATVLEGMLCVHSNSIYPGKRIKLWVLKEYGIKESWIPFLSVEDPRGAISIPKYRFADGEMLFWCTEGVMFRTRCGPFGAWPRCDTIFDGHAFRERLISPTRCGPFGAWPSCDSICDGYAFTESLISPRSLTYV